MSVDTVSGSCKSIDDSNIEPMIYTLFDVIYLMCAIFTSCNEGGVSATLCEESYT